jgi:hypothetical protein
MGIILKAKTDSLVNSEHDGSDSTEGVYINGVKVLGQQGAAIANVTPATDGTAVGTAFNTLLARLRAHGILAT